MNLKITESPQRIWLGLVVLSFLPLLFKGLVYALLESYLPIALFFVFGVFVAWGINKGARAGLWAVRTWAFALILWGLARLGVMGLFLFFEIEETHIEAQMTLWYVLLSLAYIILGFYLWRSSKRAIPILST